VRLRRQVPDAVRAVSLEERRLAWALTETGAALVATPSVLHHEGGTLSWNDIAKVTWEPPLLAVREVAEVDDTGTLHRWAVQDGEELAQVVRARVTSSVAWTDVRRLPAGGKVRVVARRLPGRDALHWQLVWLDGTDPTDPVRRAQAEELVAALRGTLG
jgi:hypothetical protein